MCSQSPESSSRSPPLSAPSLNQRHWYIRDFSAHERHRHHNDGHVHHHHHIRHFLEHHQHLHHLIIVIIIIIKSNLIRVTHVLIFAITLAVVIVLAEQGFMVRYRRSYNPPPPKKKRLQRPSTKLQSVPEQCEGRCKAATSIDSKCRGTRYDSDLRGPSR